jgi:cobalt/nickel transport system permease protein
MKEITSHLLFALVVFSLYILSGVRTLRIYRKAWVLAFLFGFLVFLPASLNVITPGEIIIRFIRLDRSYSFWVYNIPEEIGMTREGCRVTVLLFLRVLNSVSLALLLVYATSFPRLLKALRVLFVPDALMMVISLAYKYIFILCRTAGETYFAIKARLIGNIRDKAIRGLVAGRILFIYGRSQRNYEQTCDAMISRGYTGKIIFTGSERLKAGDFFALAVVVAAGILFILI